MINKTLQKIFLDSLTLREREKEINKIISVYEDPGFATKISQWKNNVGESSPEFFNKRLEWPNISRDSLEKLLNPIKEFDFNEFEFPLWICDLDDFLESVNPQNTLLKTVDIPFSDILSVLVEYFCTRICSLPRGISSGAFFDLKISLLRQLSKLASQSLLEYMNISDLSYQKFVKKLSTGGFVDFFSLYPYLARLLFVQGRFWIDNTSSTFSFFNEDYLDLCAKLKAKEVTVVHIHSDISESHNYGKNVAIFETKTAKFVFKYRDVRTEGRFFQFLDFLNSSLNIKQYVPWVIERDDHGWMEYISHSPCTSAFEIQEYYKKCGYFLALFHLLGSTDLHSENIIASGSYPVFIDLETLVSPLPNLNNPYINKLNEYIDFQYGLSVSRSGILPQWLLGPDTNVYNNSALGGRKSKVLYSKITWKNINKDDMGFEYAEQEAPEDANVVYLGKEIQNPYDYVDNILEGYSTFHKGGPQLSLRIKKFSKYACAVRI